MEPLLHITSRAAWQAARRAGSYRADSLASEGFIHCSTAAQVLTPANALFQGQPDLLLLVIDPARLSARIVWEDCYDAGQEFPHVYGPLELEAVLTTVLFPAGPDGRFSLPPDLPVDLERLP